MTRGRDGRLTLGNGAEQNINKYLQRALKQTTALAKAVQTRK